MPVDMDVKEADAIAVAESVDLFIFSKLSSVTWKNRFWVYLVLEVGGVFGNLKKNSLRVSLFRD